MTTEGPHDPVNRWATEHYGFEDAEDTAPCGRSVDAQPPVAAAPVSRRRTALIASGIVSLALVAGLGGVSAAAAVGDDGGRGGGRGAVVQIDGNTGRGARPDGGRR